jgi:hypothetical protein
LRLKVLSGCESDPSNLLNVSHVRSAEKNNTPGLPENIGTRATTPVSRDPQDLLDQ